MKKHTWLEFENDDKLNAFMTVITGSSWNYYSTTGFSRVGAGFTKTEIEMAQKEFGAKVIETPE